MATVLNGRFLTQPVTGVQRFGFEMGIRLLDRVPELRVVVPDVEWDRSRWPGPVDVVGRLGGHLWEQVDLPVHLRRHGHPLLVNLTNSGPAYYGNQIATQHDINYVNHPESYSRSFRLVYSWMAPRLLRHSRTVLTGTQHAKEEIVRHFRLATPVRVVYDAASEIFTPGNQNTGSPSRYLLAVASTSAHKNLPRLYEAMRRLAGTGVPPLWVVGSGGRSFSPSASSFSDHDMVKFLGRVSDDELVDLYRNAVAFVFPSLHEGFGLPPIEAQACGCPVIASTASCIPEVLGDSFQPFDPMDVNSIAAAIRDVADSADLRQKLRVAGARNVQRFSWDRSADQVAELITELSATN